MLSTSDYLFPAIGFNYLFPAICIQLSVTSYLHPIICYQSKLSALRLSVLDHDLSGHSPATWRNRPFDPANSGKKLKDMLFPV